MKFRIKLIFTLFILVLYLLFFPVSLKEGLHGNPCWITRAAAVIPDPALSVEPRAVRTRDFIVYIDESGRISHREKLRYGVAILDEGFINFDSVNTILVLRDHTGNFIRSIETRGYPVVRDSRLFVISTDRRKISEWGPNGELLWSAVLPSPASSFDACQDSICVGLLKGSVLFFNAEGEVVYSLQDSNSRISVVYSVALHHDYFAMVSGMDPQRLLIYRRTEGRFELYLESELSGALRRTCLLRFSPDGTMLFAEQESGAVQVYLPGKQLENLPVPGRLWDVAAIGRERLLAVLLKNGKKSKLVIIDPYSTFLLQTPVADEVQGIQEADKGLFIQSGNDVILYEITAGDPEV